MSSDSETTTSSKFRQFGLYRTIDARTEEFLKLSRRRQMKQGCACAAVSTAITVTVVVSVVLVYEYGFHAEPGLGRRHRPHWLSMLNDTEAFDNIQKNSFNVNRNTIKLIPILLKAIKQNRYLEAVLDDYPSHTPADDQETTDYPLERNIFTDARNWIRTPTSRLYAIEYKSSPLIINHLFKTRNIDDFAKSAKIMNSQRVKSYFDRMINERVAYAPNAQVSYDINILPTKPPKKYALPIHSKEQNDRVKQHSATQSNEINKSNCKCNHLSDIVRKLLRSIQQLLSKNEMCSESNYVCVGSKLTTTTQKNTASKTKSVKIVSRPDTEYNTIKGDVSPNFRKLPKTFKTSFEPKSKFLRKSNSLQNMMTSITSIQNRLPQKDIANILLAKNQNPREDYASHDYHGRHNPVIADDTTIIKSHVEPTEIYDLEHTTTKPMMAPKKGKKDQRVRNHQHFTFKQEVKNLDDAYLSNKLTTISQPTAEPKRLQKLFNYEKDATRTRNQLDNLMQKIKTNNPPTSKSQKYFQIEPHKSFSMKHQESKSELISKFGINKVRKTEDKREKKMTDETETLDNFIYNATESFQSTESSTNNRSVTEVSNINDIQTLENGFSEHNFDENNYWSREEEQKPRKNTTNRQFQQKLDESNKNNLNYFDRSKILSAQNLQIPTKNHTHVLPKIEEIFDTLTHFVDARFNSTYGFYPGSLAKESAESLNPFKSMIPKNRPQFLEIRRNDVKQDHDYDEDPNVNNYPYD